MMEEIEMIAGVPYKAVADYPFGKVIILGVKEVRIFDRLIESGYVCGVTAHQLFLSDHDRTEPVLFDDHQLAMVMDELTPEGSLEEQQIWRGYFLAGWTSLVLGITPSESLFSD